GRRIGRVPVFGVESPRACDASADGHCIEHDPAGGTIGYLLGIRHRRYDQYGRWHARVIGKPAAPILPIVTVFAVGMSKTIGMGMVSGIVNRTVRPQNRYLRAKRPLTL